MTENGMTKIDDLISRHWEWAKDFTDKNGIKYSDKYPKEDHERFWKHLIDVGGFELVEAKIEYVMKYNKMLHIV